MISFADVIKEAAVKKAEQAIHAQRVANARRQELLDAVFGSEPQALDEPEFKIKPKRTRKRRPRNSFDWKPWVPWLRRCCNRKRGFSMLGSQNVMSYEAAATYISEKTGHKITSGMVGAAVQRARAESKRLKVG